MTVASDGLPGRTPTRSTSSTPIIPLRATGSLGRSVPRSSAMPESGVQIGVQFEGNGEVLRRTGLALESHISTHATPLCLAHNPKVAGSNPAPAMSVDAHQSPHAS